MSERGFAYAVDARDVLCSVSEAWLGFARENGAPELTRERVIGRSLWDFVAGRDTRRLYEAIFDEVRGRRAPVGIPFRCDSPDRFRFMRLLLAPGAEGRIDCEGFLLREQARPFYSILQRAFPRSDETLPMCSLCKRVLVHGARWTDLAHAVGELDLFGREAVPEVEHAVCDRCGSAAEPWPPASPPRGPRRLTRDEVLGDGLRRRGRAKHDRS